MSGFRKSYSIVFFFVFACMALASALAARPAGAATAFLPSQIPGMSAWFDASVPGGLTLFGANVATWKDESGLGNDLVQAVGSYEPTYVTSGINGLGSVAFAGHNFLITASGAFSTELFNESTTFYVAYPTGKVSGKPLSSGLYDANPRFETILGTSGTTYFNFNDNVHGKLVSSVAAGVPALWTLAGSVSNKVQYFRKNGNLLATSAGSGTTVSGNYPLSVGALAQGTKHISPFTGQIGEIVSFHRYLTAAESAEMEGYLACKWGLQTRLPANHPYRSTCPQGTAFPSQPTPAPGTGALVDPPQLRSSNGLLTFNVTAQSDANGNPQFVYGGSNVPPTLRLLPGDTLVVNLTNNLPAPPAGSQYMNDVNLHYHGLHVSPQAPGDDSIDMSAAPGQSLHYSVAIPANHPTGLYWYHSHAHGESDRQTLAGMSGALIVDGIAQYAPAVANMPERVLVVRDAPLPGQALPAGDKNQMAAMRWAMQREMSARKPNGRSRARNPYVRSDPNYRRFVRPLAASPHCIASSPEAPVKALTLNGATQPSIAIRPKEQQFWRLVNAGADTYLDVAIDGTKMNLIALDGVPLASGINTPASLSVSHYVVPPASRIEFTVVGPAAGTTAYLRTNCFDAGTAGDPMPAAILASIVSTSSPIDQARRPARHIGNVAHPYRGYSAKRLATAPVTTRRTLYYSDQNNINGVAYDPSAPPMFYAQTGTVEEWTIVNNSSQVHTFHIHQVHFVVEAIDGTTQAKQYVMDNVNVPAATASGPGSVKILLDFTDPVIVGTFLLHCHILSHEDAGMMAAIRIGAAAPLSASSTSVTFASPTAATQTVTIGGGTAPYNVTACTGVASATISGTTLSLQPLAAGSCVLTVSDSSTPSSAVTLTVSVAAPAALLTFAPQALSFTSPAAAAQNVTIAGNVGAVAFAGCSGIAGASVTGQTLVVTPAAVGTCALVGTDTAGNSATLSVSVNAPVVSNALDNLTFHQNAARQGWYRNETSLTTTTVNPATFGLVATLSAPAGMPAFAKVYAQPLYATNEPSVDGNSHNLIVIATTTAQLYAFDETSRAVVWHRDFTNGGANGVRPQMWSDTGCADVNPYLGIVGTPVIDRGLDRLFVVVATMENGTPYLRLHAVGLGNGTDVVTPMVISGSLNLTTGGIASVSPAGNMDRGALLEANGNIYVPLSSHCDQNLGKLTTHGWIIAYNAATLTEMGNAVDLTNASVGSSVFLGSPWMSGFGPAADASGNIYFATGNGSYDGANDFSMTVMKLPGNLNIGAAAWFRPTTAAADSAGDADLGSGGVMLLPDQAGSVPRIAVAGGKCSLNGGGCQKYLLNRDTMGGGGGQAGGSNVLWNANTGGSMFGGPAYFVDAAGVQHVLYGGTPSLKDYTLGLAPFGLTPRSASTPTGHFGGRDPGSQPVISSNGTKAGTAVVWALQTPGNSGGQITLLAFDALNMGAPLYSGVAGVWTQTAGTSYIGEALVSPLVVNGRVYVPTDGSVSVFGLKASGAARARAAFPNRAASTVSDHFQPSP